MTTKRSRGRFYTRGNPFALIPFRCWAERIALRRQKILEPFAGANHIIRSLHSLNLCSEFVSYDIAPSDRTVRYRDTLTNFPRGYSVCITNPPWLARNSASRRRLPYPKTTYDNLYKHCLDRCLQHCDYVGALIPATFLQSGLFRDRLATYILLHDSSLFNDTENPVCLALFDKHPVDDTAIFYDNELVGQLNHMEAMLPRKSQHRNIKFNDPCGELAFVSFDNTQTPSIRFCDPTEIAGTTVKTSSRFFTRISGDLDSSKHDPANLNAVLGNFREATRDLFLTPFKGLRADGNYRRRMSFALARDFINAVA